MTALDRPPPNLRAGFYALLVFALLGLALEGLHAFKLGLYLDVSNEARRLMWRLAHAHGVLLGLLNIAYALSTQAWPSIKDALIARCFMLALLLMPLGFLLGGAFARGGDPGASVALASAGALALLVGLAKAAWKVR